jgi:adenylylsulfate kinase
MLDVPEDTLGPRALLVNGTVGVGKTSVAEAIHARLSQAQVPNAMFDVDALRRAWPQPPGDRFNKALALRNLTAVTANAVDAGAVRLVLAGVVETPSERDEYEHALGMPLVLCRLRADLPVVRERLIGRHGDSDETLKSHLEWHLHRAVELDGILAAAAVDDHVVDVTDLSVTEAAAHVLRTVGPDFE